MRQNTCSKLCDSDEYFSDKEQPCMEFDDRLQMEQARLRALSFYLIRSIVQNHGGSIDFDLSTNAININVPDDEQLACAQEIERAVGRLCL